MELPGMPSPQLPLPLLFDLTDPRVKDNAKVFVSAFFVCLCVCVPNPWLFCKNPNTTCPPTSTTSAITTPAPTNPLPPPPPTSYKAVSHHPPQQPLPVRFAGGWGGEVGRGNVWRSGIKLREGKGEEEREWLLALALAKRRTRVHKRIME